MVEDSRECVHVKCLLVHKATLWHACDSALFKVTFMSVVLEVSRSDKGITSFAIC
jgi:hypothetical protein